MSKHTGQRYKSYLLRLWQTSDEDSQAWRASLEDPGTRERHGFASLPELYGFIEAQVRSQNGQDLTQPAEKDRSDD